MRRWRSSRTLVVALLGCLAAASARGEDPPRIIFDNQPAPKAEWQLSLLKLDQPAAWLELDDDRQRLSKVRIQSAGGEWYRLATCGEARCVEPLGNDRKDRNLPKGAVPGTRLVEGTNDIREAYLAEPTERLATPWFGRQLAAGVLVAIDHLKTAHRYDVGLDRTIVVPAPRLADLDGDKRDEIITVEMADGGQRIVVYTLRGTGLERIAEASPAEAGGFVVDPVAVADFDGDGATEIATTVSDDGGSRLVFWRYRDATLSRGLTLKGFASRQPGTDHNAIGIAADFDGDGSIDLMMPSDDFKTLRVVSIAGGAAAEPMRLKLAAAISTNLLAVYRRGDKVPTIVFGLADGNLGILKQVVGGEE